MKEIEQTISSIEVAEMVGKRHTDLIRDVRRYLEQFNESNLASVEFFKESTYKDSKGEVRPCYNVTKKGCEFIAHKLELKVQNLQRNTSIVFMIWKI